LTETIVIGNVSTRVDGTTERATDMSRTL